MLEIWNLSNIIRKLNYKKIKEKKEHNINFFLIKIKDLL